LSQAASASSDAISSSIWRSSGCRSDFLENASGLSPEKGHGMPEVTIELLEGRTLEQKRGLVKDMTEAVVRNCGVQPEDVTIIIHDNLKSDKAKAGKLFSDS
jgi:4-oxalocrotonate tautomerase